MKTLVYDSFVSKEICAEYNTVKVTKEGIFKESDCISIHARLTEQDRGMIGKKELAIMKPTAYLINTARAGLVDEDSLYDVLKKNAIAGAALDVFWIEPLPSGSRSLELDNVTLTYHLAGTTRDALTKSPSTLVDDINRLLTGGKPKFLVNPEVLGCSVVQE